MAYPYTLPSLPYAYDALEPYIDAKTMEIHLHKHQQAYVDKLNEALKDHPSLQKKELVDLILNLEKLPEKVRDKVRNQGGGHLNHSMFWVLMKKKGGKPTGPIHTAIKKQFGSFDTFKEKFTEAAKTRFGSGWAWLIVNPKGDLEVVSTANQDNPLTAGAIPLLGLDVWEHAYYLKYQSKRPDYIDAWWHVVNWDQVNDYYQI